MKEKSRLWLPGDEDFSAVTTGGEFPPEDYSMENLLKVMKDFPKPPPDPGPSMMVVEVLGETYAVHPSFFRSIFDPPPVLPMTLWVDEDRPVSFRSRLDLGGPMILEPRAFIKLPLDRWPVIITQDLQDYVDAVLAAR